VYSSKLGGGGDLLDTAVPPVLMARAGLLSQAQQGIAKRLKAWRADPSLKGAVRVVKGQLALAQGHTAKAIPLLEEGLQATSPSGTFTFFLGVEALARTWEAEGNLPEAIETLERASAGKSSAGIVRGFAWMRVRWRLAQFYRKAGREQDAQRIEAELRKLLACADPDFPMLVQLKGSQDKGVARLAH
jgi:tetratricopeptide (TPR) repeat protein